MKDLVHKINKLKKERNAVILVHNYQIGEVQEIADFMGDSLGLSRNAATTEASVIVFCGVRFMAETASILSPDKKVLLPDINAGCPMADMITRESLLKLKAKHPDALVVAYVNTPASIKAEADYCCTSGNTVNVINALPKDKEIIFVPDKYLADYVSNVTGRKLISWDGYCYVHINILPSDILKQKKLHPEAKVIVHPECTKEVIVLADRSFSTAGMCNYAKTSDTKEIIIGTEPGLIYRLKKENPDKEFYPAKDKDICIGMKLTNLEKILWSLEEMKYEIKVPENIRIKAKKAVDRMMEIV